MAHFARINESGIVSEVIVISNDDCKDSDGNESEAVGIAFCKSIYGANSVWVQTSYNGRFRGKYAGAGDIYDAAADVFVTPTPDPITSIDEPAA